MKHLAIIKAPVQIRLEDFTLSGEPIAYQTRAMKEVASIFRDQIAARAIAPETSVYAVQSWLPVAEGTQGALFFGVSTIMPGKVGNEYFMTKGHFHLKSDRAEFYWGVAGKGMLILMDQNNNTWGEEVSPGSLHYIGGNTAHRLANTGDCELIVGACWPADAGHDYETIAQNGFTARLLEIDGSPKFVQNSDW
jgi:glucose-6-phosphate isomerase